MSNLTIYEAVRSVPDTAKREIKGGRLQGRTDINPVWRIKMLTEQFGACGIGWRYKIEKRWLEPSPTKEIAAFVEILLFIRLDGEWSEGIPGTGGSMYVVNEKNGLYTNDECYKMALTDAISVACKALGIGADVYWEKDVTKYSKSSDRIDVEKATHHATAPTSAPSTAAEQAAAIAFKFGKHNGKTIREVYKEDREYLDWVMSDKCENQFMKNAVGTVLTAANQAKEDNEEPEYEAFSQVDLDDESLPWNQSA